MSIIFFLLINIRVSKEHREQSQKDLNELKIAVAKELQTSRNLHTQFVQDIKDKCKAMAAGNGPSTGQKYKIKFLEAHLESTKKRSNELAVENAKLRRELSAKSARLNALEATLKGAKGCATPDQTRLEFNTLVKRLAKKTFSQR
ncbi:kinesin-1 heavy chain-like [Contarinia nasturtii]|uniref:kinesin-1 heavy chain-like n=1 Tax=Contarinia nasturtii TaxID=265458 RepID=UPI0012D4BB8A|nr:kinesin-1 heavy chain-like [Contarinia nasturtii]